MQSTVPTAERFEDLPLDVKTLASLKRIGYEKPTPIQAKFIPHAVTGRDCIGQAQTGTGKTAAFILPILQQLSHGGHDPQALVLAPTRELAVQIEGEARRLTAEHNFRVVTICGGHSIRQQIRDLQRGCDIVVGTPGRIIHQMREGVLKLGHVRHVVLDEADRMLDIGFRPDIERILRVLPRDRQTMLLSATLEPPVRRLADRYMHSPTMVEVAPEMRTLPSIRQSYFTVDADRKYELLLRLIERDQPQRCIIFCRRKRDAEWLSHDLAHKHMHVARMHGDLDQKKRDRIMEAFRSGRVRFLVCTDLVGRGIDVDDITHVINYDVPDDSENYVHRIGRTARMGKDGIAYMFVTQDQGRELTAIETFINQTLIAERLEGFESFRPRRTGGADESGEMRRPQTGVTTLYSWLGPTTQAPAAIPDVTPMESESIAASGQGTESDAPTPPAELAVPSAPAWDVWSASASAAATPPRGSNEPASHNGNGNHGADSASSNGGTVRGVGYVEAGSSRRRRRR